jgi:hypothetical protein
VIARISLHHGKFDSSGGVNSASVRRMVGPDVSKEVRTQQLVWNIQSRTPTTLRMLAGAQPMTREEWKHISVPILVISGEKVLP